MAVRVGSGDFLTGCCMELLMNVPDASVDLVLADLPYGMTSCRWDSVLPLEELWREYRRVTRESASVVLTASQPFTSMLVMSNARQFQCEWIWEKNIGSNFGTTRYQPMKEHESVLVFKMGRGQKYRPVMQERTPGSVHNIGRSLNNSSTREHHPTLIHAEHRRRELRHLRVPRSVQRFEFHRRQMGLHPTQKPVPLFEYFIRTYSDEGDLVLDNVAGSGTTAIAAENAGRRWLCMERDEDYSAVAIERVRRHLA